MKLNVKENSVLQMSDNEPSLIINELVMSSSYDSYKIQL